MALQLFLRHFNLFAISTLQREEETKQIWLGKYKVQQI